MDKKGLAMLIVGRAKHPADAGPVPDDAPGGAENTPGHGEDHLAVAGDILSAIEAKDPGALADALKAFCMLESEEGEYDSGGGETKPE